jgi:hypothetical protein
MTLVACRALAIKETHLGSWWNLFEERHIWCMVAAALGVSRGASSVAAQRLSSVTRMASILRALANARTLARSGRPLSAPDAVSLKATILWPARLANARRSLSWRSHD